MHTQRQRIEESTEKYSEVSSLHHSVIESATIRKEKVIRIMMMESACFYKPLIKYV